MADPYQALYRRYRSKRFGEQRGQEHVMRALRTAVQEDRVGHAYLFSGPRGTGKTSTARILAKVLNCERPVDGEPCCECENCKAVDEGRIVDWLLELDAASNNGVANIRELIDRIPLGTSGNRKVVILDEVHMLSTGASNALLKSLEEPPAHVVFILATTDPQKVLPTIRSRTQHFEFHLLGAEELADHVRHVIADAGLELGEDAVEHVVRQGGGSARDTLSALDQVAAMGGVVAQAQPVDAIVVALQARDAGAALVAVADAAEAGRDPRAVGEALIARLRDAFLAVMGAPDRHLPPPDLAQAEALGQDLGPAGLTRALEVLGEALVDLAKKPDPRIVLEVALVRLCRPDADRSLDALLDRIELLERALAAGAAAPWPAPDQPHAAPAPAGQPHAAAAAPPPSGARPVDVAREELARVTGRPAAGPVRQPVKKAGSSTGAARPRPDAPAAQPPAATAAPGPTSAAPPATPPAPATDPAAPSSSPTPERLAPTGGVAPTETPPRPGGGVPASEELTAAWPTVLAALKPGTKAVYGTGRFVPSTAESAVFALANVPTRDHCEKRRPEVEAALSAQLGRPVRLQLVTESEVGGAATPSAPGVAAPSPAAADDEEIVDVHDLEDAPTAASGVERLAQAFPGAELVEEP